MTNEEAKNVLHGMRADNLNLDDAYTKDKYEALSMGINALQQQSCEDVIIDKHYWKGFNAGIRTEKFRESKRQEPCEDCISRQAVFEQIGGWIASGEYEFTNATDYLSKRIKAIPPVSSSENPNKCEDAINRQAVLKMAYDISEIDGEDFTEPYMVVDVEDIQKLPPVTPQPKTGHWIGDAGTYYKAIHERGCEPDENTPIFLDDIACSECLAKFSVIDNETERFECCPHCGAKMVEPQEGGNHK